MKKAFIPIITSEEVAELTDVDCILVLDCQVKDDSTPSDMLKESADTRHRSV